MRFSQYPGNDGVLHLSAQVDGFSSFNNKDTIISLLSPMRNNEKVWSDLALINNNERLIFATILVETKNPDTLKINLCDNPNPYTTWTNLQKSRSLKIDQIITDFCDHIGFYFDDSIRRKQFPYKDMNFNTSRLLSEILAVYANFFEKLSI